MIGQPSWQGSAANCGGARTVPDISVLADSSLGVAVYSTAEKGWVVLGGTSVGAPFIAGLYAAAADYGASTIGAPRLYANLVEPQRRSGIERQSQRPDRILSGRAR